MKSISLAVLCGLILLLEALSGVALTASGIDSLQTNAGCAAAEVRLAFSKQDDDSDSDSDSDSDDKDEKEVA